MKKVFLWALVGVLASPVSGAPSVFSIGTNLGGLADYGTELPFVDLMHSARVWYTKDAANPSGPWDSQAAALLSYRPDGYPVQIPQKVAGRSFAQKVATIWADASAWPEGTYTVLYDGTGALTVEYSVAQVAKAANRLTFVLAKPASGVPQVQLVVDASDAADPVRNIRVLMPGSEKTYLKQPFNPLWLEKLKAFSSVRFMDWGATNNWGQPDPWTWSDPALFAWKDRQTLDRYTWADGRGVPYEMMIRLMNEAGFDGWVCVPHRAGAEYLREMARLFHQTLDPRRHLTVEYSNETWNWMFGQAQWLKAFGHPSATALANRQADPRQYEYDPASTWPENITGNIQDCLDAWTAEYGRDLSRLSRVVGLQTGWPDVSRRIASNLKPGTYDALAPTYYFALSDESDAVLDALGAKATVADIVRLARADREKYEKPWLAETRALAGRLGVPLMFYEGGQHLTPHPFGEEPSYAAALVAVQSSPEMKTLYTEWFQYLKTLRQDAPLVLMNFSFVAAPSARYGSWGLLESLAQDAKSSPKFAAVLDAMGW